MKYIIGLILCISQWLEQSSNDCTMFDDQYYAIIECKYMQIKFNFSAML